MNPRILEHTNYDAALPFISVGDSQLEKDYQTLREKLKEAATLLERAVPVDGFYYPKIEKFLNEIKDI